MAKIRSKNLGKSVQILFLAIILQKNSQSQKSYFSEFVLLRSITEKNLNQKYKRVLIIGTAEISQLFRSQRPKFELEQIFFNFLFYFHLFYPQQVFSCDKQSFFAVKSKFVFITYAPPKLNRKGGGRDKISLPSFEQGDYKNQQIGNKPQPDHKNKETDERR